MSKNTSITLGKHFEQFISQQLGNGRFNSTSEVVRAGLRLLEDQEYKLSALRSALIAAENSGFSKTYTIENVIKKISE